MRKSFRDVLLTEPKPRSNTEPANVQTDSRNAFALAERKISGSVIRAMQMEGLQRGFTNKHNKQNAQTTNQKAVVSSGRLALPPPETLSVREKARKLKQQRQSKKGTSPGGGKQTFNKRKS